ncbi:MULTISPECIES: RNA polymerase sigma factor [Halobacteriovorax]|uniref:RNA polymerase sigma factor n=1 Tax=Halobacteriovorax vibrionivorans TaxID=2152716 RepID=A0ABY0IFY9_9BACT|nr:MULTISPECIES: RNA polymerase sigma factor [Halobacteriovorax]AYF43579.1 sigma-70, region 4 [Halobacteriovorax sp. BALOs_7]RZF21853.1 RNA polymerase sigma factor [Halobacteriovorax vibrionivorans]TGD48313.1 RNA polymerase sigma factor [Halobacteriovorax sp. Y22]
MNDLKKLIILSQNGDQEAYRIFLEAISHIVKKIVSVKVFNESHRDDICQEILMSIHHSLPTYSPERPVTPWVNCIIERRIIDYIRKYSKLKEREEEFQEDVTNPQDLTNTGIDSIEKLIINEQLSVLINKYLTEELKRPLLMAKIEGHQTKEVAETLGITESAARTRISRAMAKLKKVVK